jgi:cytochrome c oxidase cbb3-type subunit 3
MADEYIEEMQIAQQHQEELIRTGTLINENSVTLLTDAQSLDNGKITFTNNCVPCHGPNGGGVVGPNLTDDYWIHGGGIKNIFKTIKYGVPAKGMITWQAQLNPKKMQEVASYVISLQGTNPPGGKPPEGQVWVDSTQTQTKTPGDTNKTVTKKTDSIKITPKADSIKKGK